MTSLHRLHSGVERNPVYSDQTFFPPLNIWERDHACVCVSTSACVLREQLTKPLFSETYLEVRKLLLYLWSLLSELLDLLLKLDLASFLPPTVHPNINGVINLICFPVVCFVGTRGEQTSSVTLKLGGRERILGKRNKTKII